jgi:hypothetical protein
VDGDGHESGVWLQRSFVFPRRAAGVEDQTGKAVELTERQRLSNLQSWPRKLSLANQPPKRRPGTFILMMSMFNNREIATAIWLCVPFAWVVAKPESRSSLVREQALRNSVRDAFKIIIVIEFLFNTYTFPLVVELILLPVLMFLTAILLFAEADKHNAQVARFLKILLSMFGFLILVFVLWKFVHQPDQIWSVDTLKNFALPIMLTLTYLPVAYAIALFSDYEQLFVQLKLGQDKPNPVIRYAKFRLLLALGLGLSRVHNASKQITSELRRVTTREDVDHMIVKFIGANEERHAQIKPKEKRWPEVVAIFFSTASLIISVIALLFSMEYLRPHEEHDVIATVLKMKMAMGNPGTTNNGELYLDLALINRGNQTEIIRSATLYFSENENYAQGAAYQVQTLNLQLTKGEKYVVHLIADRDTVFSGKHLWVNVGVTAIAPNADDILSVWPVGQITLASNGQGGQMSYDPNNTPKIQVISDKRLPSQKRPDMWP